MRTALKLVVPTVSLLIFCCSENPIKAQDLVQKGTAICPEVDLAQYQLPRSADGDAISTDQLPGATDKVRSSLARYRASSRSNDRRNELVTLLHARKIALAHAIVENPELALKNLLSTKDREFVRGLATGCTESATTLTGSLIVTHVDFVNGKSAAISLSLRTTEGKIYRLHAVGKLRRALQSGMTVQIQGYALDNEFVFDDSSASTLAIQASAAGINTAVQRHVAVIMLTFPDIAAPSLSRGDLVTMLTEVDAYFSEVSYGKRRISGDVFPRTGGYYMATRPLSTIGISCDLNELVNEAITVADNDVDFRDYTNIQVQVPTATCGWAGVGSDRETIQFITNDGPIGVGTSAIKSPDPSTNVGTSIHEFGHNFGLWHAGFVHCFPDSYAIDPLGNGGCHLTSYYGNVFDVMSDADRRGPLNAPHRARAGFFDPSNVVVLSTPGAFDITLEPLETISTGPKAVEIPLGDGRSIWVEYRQPIGLDAQFAPSILDGAFILEDSQWENPISMLADAKILDGTPNPWPDPDFDFFDNVFRVGQTFTEPLTGISIRPTSIVELGSGTPEISVHVEIPPQPAIALGGIYPIRGVPGNQVDLNGFGLGSWTTSVVHFGSIDVTPLFFSTDTELSFTVPDTPLTGDFPITVTSPNGTSNALNYFIPLPCEPQPIHFGQTIFGNTTETDCFSPHFPTKYADQYTFEGVAGQNIAIRTRLYVSHTTILVGPDGTRLQYSTSCPGQLTEKHHCVPTDNAPLYTLPQTGTYTIEVSSEFLGDDSPYMLILDTNPIASCERQPIAFGQTIDGNLQAGDCGYITLTPGYVDFYGFMANAGDEVRIEVETSDFNSTLRLHDPDVSVNETGETIYNAFDCPVNAGNNDACIPATTTGYFLIPETGQYTIQVTTNSWVEGAYRVTLLRRGDLTAPARPRTTHGFERILNVQRKIADDPR